MNTASIPPVAGTLRSKSNSGPSRVHSVPYGPTVSMSLISQAISTPGSARRMSAPSIARRT
jgi:hypothetical protein